jgi:DNA-binding transcriptional LysR family regulator
MNLETLHYFQYIAKYKNITRAAKHFYISQSTLSRNIMLLEKELGVQLFERNNKQIELTEAGKVFEHDCELFIKICKTLPKM